MNAVILAAGDGTRFGPNLNRDDVHQRRSEYLSGLELPSSLDAIGLDRQDLADLWTRVDPKRFTNAPIELSQTECLSLFDFAAGTR
ncbi:MAG: hypothetical protein WA005_10175 [Candidatus Binataceae bacterium]